MTTLPSVLYLDVNTEWRGGQRQVLWLAQGMRARGARVMLALRPHAALTERARAAGLTVMNIDPWIPEFGPWTVLRLRRFLQRKRIDILHPQDGHSMGLAALAALGTRTKVVFARRVARPLHPGAATRWKYRRADRIISVSRAGIHWLAEIGIDPARIDVVPSGIPLDREIEPASPETLRAVGVPPGVPLAVLVGALAEMKDPLTFVRAIAVARQRVPAVHALLVGDGPLRADIERERGALGLDDVVHLAGFRRDADALLATASVAVLSSWKDEGTPGVLMDAMALGLPIVATSAGGTAEVVEADVSGLLVPPRDARALGEAIARVLAEPALASRLAAGARARAPMFSIERTIQLTIESYLAALRGRSPPRADS